MLLDFMFNLLILNLITLQSLADFMLEVIKSIS